MPPNVVNVKPAGGATTPIQCASLLATSATRAASTSLSTCCQKPDSPPEGAVPKLASLVSVGATETLSAPTGMALTSVRRYSAALPRLTLPVSPPCDDSDSGTNRSLSVGTELTGRAAGPPRG